MRLFVFGLGYTGKAITAAFGEDGWTSVGSTGSEGTVTFDDDDGVAAAMAEATHVISTIAPWEGDPVLTRYGSLLEDHWLGYISSTGVYGDTGGAWVDESAPTQGRRAIRIACEERWLDLGATVFRLPGIYGPGRSAIDRLRAGTAHRIGLPDQVFSRIHVEDAAWAFLAAAADDIRGEIFNIADDLPASANAVTEEAARLLGLGPPPLQSLEEAKLSPQARAFYAENRRVANGKAKRVLGWLPRYPTYREGLASLL